MVNFLVTITYGSAAWIGVAQNIFSNKLIERLLDAGIGVAPSTVINSGATHLRNTLPAEQFAEVLRVFMDSLKDAYVLPIALNAVSMFIAAFLDKKMRTIKTKDAKIA